MPLRRALEQVTPFRPQRPMRELQAELGLERIVKLAANEGAFGPLPAAVAAFEAAVGELNRYPDPGGLRLREEIGGRFGLPVEQIVLGNGADELIRLCAVATLDAGDRVVFPWPSFPSYVSAAACSAAEAVRVPLRDHEFDPEAVLAACSAQRTKLVYIANPNNPTGHLIDREVLRSFLSELPDGVLCVLDEAYADYAEPEPEGPELVRDGVPRLAVLRTFSKVYGLAALRIGYALASPEMADGLDRVRPIYNVNQPAQEAALASMHERDAVALRVEHARGGRLKLHHAMTDAGLEPVPSQANFVFAEVRARGAREAGHPAAGDGAGLARALLEQEGVIVRALAEFGAPGAIRVTVGTDEENGTFTQALHSVLRSG
jgi:histidinol-phosphate aminotransferase